MVAIALNHSGLGRSRYLCVQMEHRASGSPEKEPKAGEKTDTQAVLKGRMFGVRLIQFVELAAHGDASWLTLICRLTSGPVYYVPLEWSML